MATSNIIVSGLTISLDSERARLAWSVNDPNVSSGSTTLQLNTVEVWRSQTNDWATATKIIETRANKTLDVNLFAGATYFYWLRARDNSGNLGALYPDALAGTQFFAGFISRNTTLINGKIVVSNPGNALRFDLKTANGADPSIDNPATIQFYNIDGTFNPVSVTAPLSVQYATPASTFGFVAFQACRIYCVAILTNGVVYLGAINTLAEVGGALAIAPLNDRYIYAGVEIGDATPSGAWLAGIIWHNGSGAASGSPYRIMSFHDWVGSIATPGVWNALPSINVLYGSDIPLPGSELQRGAWKTSNLQGAQAFNVGGTGGARIITPYDDTIPQLGEYWTLAGVTVTGFAGANYLEMDATINVSASISTDYTGVGWAPTNDQVSAMTLRKNSAADEPRGMRILHHRRVGFTGTQNWEIALMLTGAGSLTVNGVGGARKFGGVLTSAAFIAERMG